MNFDNSAIDGQWGYTFGLSQMVFVATAATIVSRAMVERTKFSAYLCFRFFTTLFIYPVFGHRTWGNRLNTANADTGAWLSKRGFIDFAGSTVVHSVGGWAALDGAISVGLGSASIFPASGSIRSQGTV